MSLRLLAEKDLGVILEDDTHGFGWPITVTNPAGKTENMTGFSDDIEQVIDPDTGQAVSGRLVSVALRISSLIELGFGLPVGIADSAKKPWIVQFYSTNGLKYPVIQCGESLAQCGEPFAQAGAIEPTKFKVSKSNPDRTAGLVTCLLEFYSD